MKHKSATEKLTKWICEKFILNNYGTIFIVHGVDKSGLLEVTNTSTGEKYKTEIPNETFKFYAGFRPI